MKKNIIITVLFIVTVLLSFLLFHNDNGETVQLFLGNWKVVDIMPVEISISSAYSGFDENDNFRGQDLIDNIVGQEVFFGIDYIKNQDKIYELSENYVIHIIPILSDYMMIGSTSAKNLGITGEYFLTVFFDILSEEKNDEGNRDFKTLNQLYLKDKNTIYASINGCLTFKLERIGNK